MARRVAISDSLSPVKRTLYQAGYDVVNLESDADISKKGIGDYDAVIVSGMDDNLMGMQDISGKALVINAAGKAPDEILDELNSRFR
jgi:hypothetical protein